MVCSQVRVRGERAVSERLIEALKRARYEHSQSLKLPLLIVVQGIRPKGLLSSICMQRNKNHAASKSTSKRLNIG